MTISAGFISSHVWSIERLSLRAQVIKVRSYCWRLQTSSRNEIVFRTRAKPFLHKTTSYANDTVWKEEIPRQTKPCLQAPDHKSVWNLIFSDQRTACCPFIGAEGRCETGMALAGGLIFLLPAALFSLCSAGTMTVSVSPLRFILNSAGKRRARDEHNTTTRERPRIPPEHAWYL